MVLSLKELSKENRVAAEALGKEFSFVFSDDGVPVKTRECDFLTAEYDGRTLAIGCKGGKGFFRALSIAAAMPSDKPFSMKESYGLDRFGLMVDCSRGAVPKPDTIKQLIRYMAALGYNTLQLYLEDLFKVEGEPFFGYLRGRYSREELCDLDGYAALFGIEIIPCVQTLAHFPAPSRWQPFAEGKFDLDDILLVDEEKTYEFIEKIFAEMRGCFRSKEINIGMDEAHRLGLGKYLEKHGYQDRFEILCRHLERVSAIAEKYDFRPMMWSDMFFRLAFQGEYSACGGSVPPQVRERVPKNVKLIYWDYYSTEEEHYEDMFRAHKEFPVPVVFAGGFWKWKGFTAHNGFTFKATEAALRSAKRQKIREAFFTMWGDDGAECPLFAVLPSIVSTAESVYGHDDAEWIANRFYELVGIKFDDFMTIDLPDVLENDPYDLKNPSKYLLYNDCLMGIFDCTTDKHDGELYAEYAEKLKRFARHKKWGYLFATAAALCRVLTIKANLGNYTHEAYFAKNREALSDIAEHDYVELLKELRIFQARFRRQWNTENKPQGAEINETRLGGLYGRIKSCRDTLRAYLSGNTGSIPELEEPLIDLNGQSEFSHRHVVYNRWTNIFTGGVL